MRGVIWGNSFKGCIERAPNCFQATFTSRTAVVLSALRVQAFPYCTSFRRPTPCGHVRPLVRGICVSQGGQCSAALGGSPPSSSPLVSSHSWARRQSQRCCQNEKVFGWYGHRPAKTGFCLYSSCFIDILSFLLSFPLIFYHFFLPCIWLVK